MLVIRLRNAKNITRPADARRLLPSSGPSDPAHGKTAANCGQGMAADPAQVWPITQPLPTC
jgi:hypothetical protein